MSSEFVENAYYEKLWISEKFCTKIKYCFNSMNSLKYAFSSIFFRNDNLFMGVKLCRKLWGKIMVMEDNDFVREKVRNEGLRNWTLNRDWPQNLWCAPWWHWWQTRLKRVLVSMSWAQGAGRQKRARTVPSPWELEDPQSWFHTQNPGSGSELSQNASWPCKVTSVRLSSSPALRSCTVAFTCFWTEDQLLKICMTNRGTEALGNSYP